MTPNRTIHIIPLLFLVVMSIIGCANTMDGKLTAIEADLVVLEKQEPEVITKEMEKMGEELDQIALEIESDRKSFTDQQIEKLGYLQGRYAALLVRQETNSFKQTIQDAGNQIKGFMKGLKDAK